MSSGAFSITVNACPCLIDGFCVSGPELDVFVVCESELFSKPLSTLEPGLFFACQHSSGKARPNSAQNIYFPNLYMGRMVLQSHIGALFLWALPILSYADWLTSVPQILFQHSGLFLFLIKGKIISKTSWTKGK